MEHKHNCGISFLIMAYKIPTVISVYSSDGTDKKRKKNAHWIKYFQSGIQPNTKLTQYHKYQKIRMISVSKICGQVMEDRPQKILWKAFFMRFSFVANQERWKDYTEQDLRALNMNDQQQGLGKKEAMINCESSHRCLWLTELWNMRNKNTR